MSTHSERKRKPVSKKAGESESPIQRLLSRLEDVQSESQGKSWMARCPAHDDSTPSLHVTVDDHGDVGLYCHGGCDIKDVLKALGLKWPDLFSRKGNGRGKLHPPERHATGEPPEQSAEQSMTSGVEGPPEGCTLLDYADAKGLDLEMLKEWGLFEKVYQGRTVVHMPYRNETGETTAVRRRLSLKKGPQRLTGRARRIPTLYGLWRLEEFRSLRSCSWKGRVTVIRCGSMVCPRWAFPALTRGKRNGPRIWQTSRRSTS